MHLYYETLPWYEPEKVFECLFANKDNVFWLDSSRAEKSSAGFSYMGTGRVKNGKQELYPISLTLYPKSDLPFLFHSGYVGYVEYEGDNMWLYVDRFLVFDHWDKVIYIVYLAEDKIEAEEWFKDIKYQILNIKNISQSRITLRVPNKKLNINNNKILNFHLARSHDQYLKDIATCKEYLRKGESYQICLTNQININFSIDPFELYKIVRKKNPVPFGAYIKRGDTAVLCASPEKFLSVDRDRWVETKPIKGTSKRSRIKEEDDSLAQALLESEKNRAENVMITDLLRNDLGKICEIGTVTVKKLLAVESYSSVHHLVSTIRGKLRKDKSVLDCIKACFPGGSMTGAPKLRTREILKKLEKEPRGIYSGALGFLSLDGTAELNIVIRTIVKKGDDLSIGTGGAILIDSDPEQEYDEMILKATPLMETITEVVGAKKYTIK